MRAPKKFGARFFWHLLFPVAEDETRKKNQEIRKTNGRGEQPRPVQGSEKERDPIEVGYGMAPPSTAL
jgi:hypothetical protein